MYPNATKGEADITTFANHWQGPGYTIKLCYSDGSPELASVCKKRGWRYATSTPGVPQRNGLPERVVRTCIEGASCMIAQPGLVASWWTECGPHYIDAHDITDGPDGKSPYEKRHSEPFPASSCLAALSYTSYRNLTRSSARTSSKAVQSKVSS